MQPVLMGLNPDSGRDFVSVYRDDVWIFSKTLTDHLEYLESFESSAGNRVEVSPNVGSSVKSGLSQTCCLTARPED